MPPARPLPAPNFAHSAINPSTDLQQHLGNADTGTTGHYIAMNDQACLTDIQPTVPLTVTLPDGSTATSTHTGLLNLPHLPPAARECHLFPTFRGSLISIGLLCDHGMVATFDATKVTITHNGQTVLSGHRSPAMPLWMFRLAPAHTDPPIAANVAPTTTQKDLIAFLHAAMGSPAISTLTTAIRCGYTRIPGLTVKALHRHPPTSMATAKGHLDRTRQGQHSTRIPTAVDPPSDAFPTSRSQPSSHVYTRLFETSHRQFMDLTGRFPVTSQGLSTCTSMVW